MFLMFLYNKYVSFVRYIFILTLLKTVLYVINTEVKQSLYLNLINCCVLKVPLPMPAQGVHGGEPGACSRHPSAVTGCPVGPGRNRLQRHRALLAALNPLLLHRPLPGQTPPPHV